MLCNAYRKQYSYHPLGFDFDCANLVMPDAATDMSESFGVTQPAATISQASLSDQERDSRLENDNNRDTNAVISPKQPQADVVREKVASKAENPGLLSQATDSAKLAKVHIDDALQKCTILSMQYRDALDALEETKKDLISDQIARMEYTVELEDMIFRLDKIIHALRIQLLQHGRQKTDPSHSVSDATQLPCIRQVSSSSDIKSTIPVKSSSCPCLVGDINLFSDGQNGKGKRYLIIEDNEDEGQHPIKRHCVPPSEVLSSSN
jgi:hypothetical protein